MGRHLASTKNKRMKFQYKMTQRPFGIGCQPKGAVDCINSNRGLTGYHSIAVYDRELTPEEIKSFELTPVETFANYIEAPKIKN